VAVSLVWPKMLLVASGHFLMAADRSALLLPMLGFLHHVQVDEGEVANIFLVVRCGFRQLYSFNSYRGGESDENPHQLVTSSGKVDERVASVHCGKNLRFNTAELSVFDGME